MKKETLFSAFLLIIGFVFEFLYLGTDQLFFVIKFWVLGVICIIAGACGLILYGVIPLLERRAEMLGKSKRKR